MMGEGLAFLSQPSSQFRVLALEVPRLLALAPVLVRVLGLAPDLVLVRQLVLDDVVKFE